MEEEWVCAECFSDRGLQRFLKDRAVSKACSFCGAISDQPIAAPLEEVVTYMDDCIRQEYDHAANWLPYETAEGGYIGVCWDTADLLTHELQLELPRDHEGKLLRAIVTGLGERLWCERDPFGPNDEERARFSWERFCHVVKHERRFFFWKVRRDPQDPDVLSPAETLETISNYAEKVGLFVPLKKRTVLFRARCQHTGEVLESAQDLGPPPIDRATQPNRMSPSGIVMFYASDHPETALREISCRPDSTTVVIGRFETLRDAVILDLTRVPELPSLFEPIPDSLDYRPRQVIRFLRHVSEEISKPIERDGREHIEYVPTQVVTEFVRFRRLADGTVVEGIRYASSVHPGHCSYVLFATQENIYPGPPGASSSDNQDRWLKFVGVAHRVNRTCSEP